MSDNNILEFRLRLRTKTSPGDVSDHTQLYNNEIVFGNTEKCIVVKDPENNNLYKFPKLDDTSEDSLTSTWSAFQIKSYVDGVISEAQNTILNYIDQEFQDFQTEIQEFVINEIEAAENTAIVLPATSIMPKNDLIGCDYFIPMTLNGVAPTYSYQSNYSKFELDNIGYWNIIVPDNYEDGLKNASICLSNATDGTLTNIVFRLTAFVFDSSAANFDTGLTPMSSNYIEFTVASLSDNNMITTTIETTNQLFGAETNANKFCVMELKLTGLTQTTSNVNFHYLKLQYE